MFFCNSDGYVTSHDTLSANNEEHPMIVEVQLNEADNEAGMRMP